MRFDMRHLTRSKVDKDYTVLRHPSGHEIKINNNHLSPKMRGELEAVPMAEGGEVSPQQQETQPPPFERSAEIDNEVNNLENTMQKVDPQPVVPAAQTYETPPPTEDMSLAPMGQGITPNPNDPYGVEAGYKAYTQGLGEQRQGLEKQAQAESQQARESIPIMQRQADQQQVLADIHQKTVNELNQERHNLMEDAMKGHVNPNQYWEDKSLPGKISTIVGLIVGGLGGSDAPVKMLQSQIDRNIEAQKINLSNKHNLLNANRAQYGVENDAVTMTKAMNNDQVATQLKITAAKTTDPMAKARLLQAAGTFDKESAQIVGQTALRRSMLNGAKSGQLDPATIVRFSPFIPENEKEATFKELASAQSMTKAKNSLLSSWDKYSQMNKYGERASAPFQSKSQMDSIDAELGQLAKDSEGRVTDADVGYLRTQLPNITDNAKTRQYKREKFNAFISQKMNFPRLKSIPGVIESLGGRYNDQGQNKIQESAPKVK